MQLMSLKSQVRWMWRADRKVTPVSWVITVSREVCIRRNSWSAILTASWRMRYPNCEYLLNSRKKGKLWTLIRGCQERAPKREIVGFWEIWLKTRWRCRVCTTKWEKMMEWVTQAVSNHTWVEPVRGDRWLQHRELNKICKKIHFKKRKQPRSLTAV